MAMDAPSDMGGALRQRAKPIESDGSSVSHVEAHSVPLSPGPRLSSSGPSSSSSGSSTSGIYYGVRFGKSIPWVSQFPFGVLKDLQYVGSIMSFLACLSWVPFLYILLWILGYVCMIREESKVDLATCAKPLLKLWLETDS